MYTEVCSFTRANSCHQVVVHGAFLWNLADIVEEQQARILHLTHPWACVRHQKRFRCSIGIAAVAIDGLTFLGMIENICRQRLPYRCLVPFAFN